MAKHNHAFFGVAVEGCPACDELAAEGPTKVEPPAPEPGKMALSKQDLIEILREARRPDPDTEAENARKKQVKENSKAMLIQAIEQGRKEKERIQDMCGGKDWKKGHRKWDPVQQIDRGTAVVWKRHSNGDATGICLRCQREFGPEPANLHPEAGGVISGRSWQEPAPVGAAE